MAAQEGAGIVDVMGDLFDKVDGELSFNAQAVEKQKLLIKKIQE